MKLNDNLDRISSDELRTALEEYFEMEYDVQVDEFYIEYKGETLDLNDIDLVIEVDGGLM